MPWLCSNFTLQASFSFLITPCRCLVSGMRKSKKEHRGVSVPKSLPLAQGSKLSSGLSVSQQWRCHEGSDHLSTQTWSPPVPEE